MLIREHALFTLDDDITETVILAALSAIQAYRRNAYSKVEGDNRRMRIANDLDIKITVVSRNPEYRFLFERTIRNLVYKADEDLSAQKHITPDITMYKHLSVAEAKKLATPTKRHVAMAFGILIGSEAGSMASVTNLLPRISKLPDLYLDIGPWTMHTYLEELTDIILAKEKDYVFSWRTNMYGTLEERAQDIANSKAIIGFPGFATYLGSCYNKPVLELKKDTSWFITKWSNPRYVQAIISESNLKQDLQKGIDALWEHLLEQTSTVRETFAADNAVDLLEQ